MYLSSCCSRESGSPKAVICSGNEAVSKRLEKFVVIVIFIVMLVRTVDCRNCCLSYVVFNGDASSLYICMSIFCSYVVFDVLPNYYCSASIRCLIWVSSAVYRVIQEESAILWEMIVCVILSKKVHMNMGPILKSF
jgi:hypothetical protein